MTSIKIEKIINLPESINPTELYGINNRNIEAIKKHLTELKIVERGSSITLNGSGKDIAKFESVFTSMINLWKKKSSLIVDDIDKLFNMSKDNIPENDYTIAYGNEGRIIKARTKNQRKLVEEYYKNDLIFAIGPAGTGKTYTAIALAVRALKNREVKKLILTRPAVEAGERLGFLPGDLKDKLDPYLQPLYDALRDMIQPKKLELLMEEGTIQIAPLAYMRGRTLENAFVILDEAQNTSLGQLKMFLTRMGNNAKFIVTGDITQIDLPNKKDSGLERGIEIVKNIKGIATIHFSNEDIVRHPLVTKIVKAFDTTK